MKDIDIRMWLGIVLLLVGLFYKGGFPINIPVVKPKLSAPEQSIIDLVDTLPNIDDPVDANKLAGTFYAMSQKILEMEINSNLQVQYFLDYVGKNTIKDELFQDGEKKYPNFSPAAANLIEKTIGPQTETEALTDEEKQNLSKLLYGFAWKMYDKDQDNVFESYKSKALSSIAEYNKEDETPDPEPDTDCPCEGKGYIIHGDGHRTDCPCIESGKKCECNPKCGSVKASDEIQCQCVSKERKTKCGCVKAYGKCSCPKSSSENVKNKCSFVRGIFGWRKI